MTAAWRVFDVRVHRLSRLSPSFLRVTVCGDDLDVFADNGYDQRIKLILPLPGSGLADLPTGPDWYAAWRALPDERRNPVRTYTVRAVRQRVREVDVDMVRHESGHGPAARWMESARVGDPLALLGPDAGHPGPHGGVEYRPPAGTRTVLLAGDETAVPAISSIVERLLAGPRAEVVLEVPWAADFLPLDVPPGVRVAWRARGGGSPGSQLVPAVRAAAARIWPAPTLGPAVDDLDPDGELLWEVPDEAGPTGGGYAWLAGEAGVIAGLRRYLVSELGVDRRSVAFMGYWRIGRAETTG